MSGENPALRPVSAAAAPASTEPATILERDGRPRHVRVKAPGKINVAFAAGPLRADGYHAVASTYLAVSLYEEVRVSAKPGTPASDVSVSINPASTLPAHQLAGIPLDGRNLAVQAALLIAEVSEQACGVHIDITKHVPIAGGMGGGSADAAATLLACDALWRAGLSREELSLLGAELGADVPFALLGGAAVGLGVGDQLTAALAPEPLHWVLVLSELGLSTPTVYAEMDRLRAAAPATLNAAALPTPHEAAPAVLAALRAGDAEQLAPHLANDLQAAAFSLAPSLRGVLAHGLAAGALAGMVSGSGPTLALLAADARHARAVAEELALAGLHALPVQGPVHGATRLFDS